MARKKTKITNYASIAQEVSQIHGISLGLAQGIVESTFEAMYRQFTEETGKVRMPGIGTMEVSISIRSGQAKGFFMFRPLKRMKDWLADLPKNPKNEQFLEYLLERDEVKYERYETGRLVKLEKIKGWRLADQARDRARIARYAAEHLGVAVNPEEIHTEYLTPPRDHNARLPDHRVSVREMLTKSGGLPPAKSTDQSNPAGDTQPE